MASHLEHLSLFTQKGRGVSDVPDDSSDQVVVDGRDPIRADDSSPVSSAPDGSSRSGPKRISRGSVRSRPGSIIINEETSNESLEKIDDGEQNNENSKKIDLADEEISLVVDEEKICVIPEDLVEASSSNESSGNFALELYEELLSGS